MRRTLGMAVFSGMLGVTFFGIFLTPVFYYVVIWLTGSGTTASATPTISSTEPPDDVDEEPL